MAFLIRTQGYYTPSLGEKHDFFMSKKCPPSIVDDSSYEPNSEIVKQLLASRSGNIQGAYDVQAYNANGAPLPHELHISRQKGVDMAELSQEALRLQKEVDSKIDLAKRDAEINLLKQDGHSELQADNLS